MIMYRETQRCENVKNKWWTEEERERGGINSAEIVIYLFGRVVK